MEYFLSSVLTMLYMKEVKRAYDLIFLRCFLFKKRAQLVLGVSQKSSFSKVDAYSIIMCRVIKRAEQKKMMKVLISV